MAKHWLARPLEERKHLVKQVPEDSLSLFEECSICRGILQSSEHCRLFPCNHRSFHFSCINHWFKQNNHAQCPVCRSYVEAYNIPVQKQDLNDEDYCVCGAIHEEMNVIEDYAKVGLYHPPPSTNRKQAMFVRRFIYAESGSMKVGEAQQMFRELLEALGPDYNQVEEYLNVLRSYVAVDQRTRRTIRSLTEHCTGQILGFLMGFSIPLQTLKVRVVEGANSQDFVREDEIALVDLCLKESKYTDHDDVAMFELGIDFAALRIK